MTNLLSKLIFYFKKPPVIVIIGGNKELTTEDIFRVLKNYFKAGKFQKRKNPSFLDILKFDILIFEKDEEDLKNFQFFLNKSKKPILVITDFISFSVEILPSFSHLILNFDNETVKKIKDKSQAHSLTFGFQDGSDFRATDIHLNKIETNFKINYKGNIVPLWLEKGFKEKQIYSALATAAVGAVLDINLVEISKSLKS